MKVREGGGEEGRGCGSLIDSGNYCSCEEFTRFESLIRGI